ncbi:MAG: sigma-70 family RNA polymerase sigma factor, partial [Bacteroidota bacterium]
MKQSPTPSDAMLAELIGRLLRRDRTALDTLYTAYGGALLRIINGMLPRQEEAEEVLQDTFLKIWQHVDRFDSSKGRFFTWAAQIARRSALDKSKTKKYQQHRYMETIAPGAEQGNLGNTEMVTSDPGLRSVIDKLRPKRRAVIECFYFNNLTQKETSEHLNLPLGTVKTELRNAIIELREILKKENPNLLSG